MFRKLLLIASTCLLLGACGTTQLAPTFRAFTPSPELMKAPLPLNPIVVAPAPVKPKS